MWAKGSLGPLHTRAKNHDLDIVRAPKIFPKVVPRQFQNHVMWSRALKFSMIIICDWALDQLLCQWIFIHAGSSDMIKSYKSAVVRFQSATVSRFCVRPTSKRWFLRSPSAYEAWSIWCHVGIHVDFTSILHFLAPLVSQSVEWTDIGFLCLFYQWEFLCRSQMVNYLVLARKRCSDRGM